MSRMLRVVLVDKGFHTVGDEYHGAFECFSYQNVSGIEQNTVDVQSR